MYTLKEHCEGWEGEIKLHRNPAFTKAEDAICKGFLHVMGDVIASISAMPANETRERLVEFVGTGVAVFKEGLLENLAEFMHNEAWQLQEDTVEKIFGGNLAKELFKRLKSAEEKEQIVPILPPYIMAQHQQEEQNDFFREGQDEEDNKEDPETFE